MSSLVVRSPGFSTTVQDLGRFGYQDQGVPPSGALDPDALETANLLVGNPRGEAGLECVLSGPELECEEAITFAVCGASMDLRINGEKAPLWQTLRAGYGDILSLGTAESGLRTYIAFSGGLAVKPILGSRSSYPRAGFPGILGRPLAAKDRLEIGTGISGAGAGERNLWVPREARPSYASEIVLRAIPFHETDRFTPESVERFFSGAYCISPKSDRMGCRLEGTPLSHTNGADIISSGVLTGTVQVPGDGLPIVLLADRQTTGGYTRIAQVIQADLSKLGQARPGDIVRFHKSTAGEARNAWFSREKDIPGSIHPVVKTDSRETRTEPPRTASEGSFRRFRITVNERTYDVVLRET